MFRREDFKKIELFGNGKKNTKIFKVQHLKTGKMYVLKEIEAVNLDKLNEYKEEAVQLSRIQMHKNVLQILGYYFTETSHKTYKLGIITEYIDKDLLLELIFRKRQKLKRFWKEEELLTMIYSMIDAFAFLEHINICHRDIKPTNLFLLKNNEIKVIDFGESKEFIEEDEDEHSTMATIRGTPQYLSPVLWEAHVIQQAKQVQHNIFKSDVFSCGLVIFQMCSLRDVTGFNQKTEYTNGEYLINDGLKYLTKMYSYKIINIIKVMLAFNENDRPNFIELGQIIAGKNYTPRTDLSLYQLIIDNKNKEKNSIKNTSSNNDKRNNTYDNSNTINSTMSNNKNTLNNNNNYVFINKEKTDEEKISIFKKYTEKNKLCFNNPPKCVYWFEYGGNIVAKYNIKPDNIINISNINNLNNLNNINNTNITNNNMNNSNINNANNNNTSQLMNKQNKNRWRIVTKYNNNNSFPYHLIQVPTDSDEYGIFLIGGTDSNNTFQFKNNEIYKKHQMNINRSFMSCIYLENKKKILAIGGYEYNEKSQLNSIEVYDIVSDKWKMNEYENLKIARSQCNAILFNSNTIYVFGGYNKNFGTLNSIEKISVDNKSCELLDKIKLPLPLRRFTSLKISQSKVIIFGGITRLCKEVDSAFIIDFEHNNCIKAHPLDKSGIIDHFPVVDEMGQIHLFYENNYGTSPNNHVIYNYLDYLN